MCILSGWAAGVNGAHTKGLKLPWELWDRPDTQPESPRLKGSKGWLYRNLTPKRLETWLIQDCYGQDDSGCGHDKAGRGHGTWAEDWTSWPQKGAGSAIPRVTISSRFRGSLLVDRKGANLERQTKRAKGQGKGKEAHSTAEHITSAVCERDFCRFPKSHRGKRRSACNSLHVLCCATLQNARHSNTHQKTEVSNGHSKTGSGLSGRWCRSGQSHDLEDLRMPGVPMIRQNIILASQWVICVHRYVQEATEA